MPYAMLSDETRRKTDEALWSQVRDVVKGAFDRARFDSLVDKIEGSQADKIEGDVVKTVNLHGNTSAASIPLALSVARADGRIKDGDLVMVEAMGGGFTWGSALIRW